MKLYLPEAGSGDLNRLLSGRRDLLIGDLSVTELVSSLCRRRREGALDSEVVLRLHRTLLSHVETGVYRRVDLSPESHREAERLMISLEGIPLRAADSLHLALAVAGSALSVVTYDARFASAARAAGFQVFP